MRVTPTCHLWMKGAQTWITSLLENGSCFDTGPESEKTLRAQWTDAQSANS